MPRMTTRQYQQLVKSIEQLKLEKDIKREPISVSGKAILDFVVQNQADDYLLTHHGPNNFKSLDKCPCPLV